MIAYHITATREQKGRLQSKHRRSLLATGAAIAVLLAAPNVVFAMDFPEALERVNHALRTNPSRVSNMALDACLGRRDFAIRLYHARMFARAERSLKFCFDALKISENPVVPTKKAGPSMEETQAKAAREVERALELTPNVENGLEIYRSCALCHRPEGWGLANGSVPQLAGQHRSVVIKQLADIRAGNRDSLMMIPYASVEAIGGAQAVADVAGYIDTLEISVANGKGPGNDLELGKRLYGENCATCHGDRGEGVAEKNAPRIQAQHYRYLLRQFGWIQDGKRRNANADMAAQIKEFGDRETQAVLDYVSRLEPPEELQAPEGWRNPDFVERVKPGG
jgi:cytochrome c553